MTWNKCNKTKAIQLFKTTAKNRSITLMVLVNVSRLNCNRRCETNIRIVMVYSISGEKQLTFFGIYNMDCDSPLYENRRL